MLKNFSIVNHFNELYFIKENRSKLDLISHIVFSLLFKEENKEVLFFPKVLTSFSISELFNLVLYFSGDKIYIPNVKKIKYCLYVTYGYYLLKINEVPEEEVWEFKSEMFSSTLGKNIQDRQTFLAHIEKIHNTIDEEMLHYFEVLDSEEDTEKTIFVISTFIFNTLFTQEGTVKNNFFPELFNFFPQRKIIKLIFMHQGEGRYIVLKVPPIERLNYAVLVLLTYFYIEEKQKEWKEVKSIMNINVDRPRKVIADVKAISREVDKKIQEMIGAK